MAEYMQVVRVLPRPSPEQISSFVAYVAGAHSWYKHLPLTPPGVQFFFFLDPNAGCDLLLGPGGTAKYRQRTESTQRFHHLAHYQRIPPEPRLSRVLCRRRHQDTDW